MSRHAIVTGSSSGIGAAIVDRLLGDGWTVIGISRTAPPGRPAAYTHRAVDLLTADPATLREAVAGPPATALIHAAGIMRGAALGALSAEEGAEMWRLHVEVATQLADLVVPEMTAGGRVVLIGSRASTGGANRSQYAATKAAVVALARSWALELIPRGITVNVVSPATTDTPMLRDPKRAGTPAKAPPIGRLIKPREVAATVAFLLSEDAAAITGQQIMICGGASL